MMATEYVGLFRRVNTFGEEHLRLNWVSRADGDELDMAEVHCAHCSSAAWLLLPAGTDGWELLPMKADEFIKEFGERHIACLDQKLPLLLRRSGMVVWDFRTF